MKLPPINHETIHHEPTLSDLGVLGERKSLAEGAKHAKGSVGGQGSVVGVQGSGGPRSLVRGRWLSSCCVIGWRLSASRSVVARVIRAQSIMRVCRYNIGCYTPTNEQPSTGLSLGDLGVLSEKNLAEGAKGSVGRQGSAARRRRFIFCPPPAGHSVGSVCSVVRKIKEESNHREHGGHGDEGKG